jgi:N6-L-threonylcarbamoyladenine synthase
LLGSTVDDAAGEAFDKVGKMLGLPYPGGPHVEKLAAQGNAARFDLPRPMLGRPKPDFSFSGLKTAVRLEVERSGPLTAADIADACASFQAAVVDTVIDRCRSALRLFRETIGQPAAIVVAGGVAANGALRRALMRFCGEGGLRVVVPPPELCTDNGAMIAWAGIERLSLGLTDDMTFAARPRWPLDANAEAAHFATA